MKHLSHLPFAVFVAPIFASPREYAKTSLSKTYESAPTGASYDNYEKSSYKQEKYKTKSKTMTSGDGFPTLSPSTDGYAASDDYSSTTGTGTGTESSPDPTQSPSIFISASKSANPSESPPTASPSGGVISSGGISLPAGCSQKNGIGIGWLPSDVPLSKIESLIGSTACWNGQYSQITTTGGYTDASHQFLGHLNDISNSDRTIFVASVMPTIPFAKVDSLVAQGVARVLGRFTARGIEVWLRYAHEMNYYSEPGSRGGHYTGTPDEFQTSWATMSAAVQSNPKIKMFWSPNQASSPDALRRWYPRSGHVDIVGIDVYPRKQQSFADTYGAFCKAFSTAEIPFAIGETGAGPELKGFWLKELVSPGAKTACPNYLGFSWFEYDKEADFRVVTGGSNIGTGILG